jgi:hypothetical protein
MKPIFVLFALIGYTFAHGSTDTIAYQLPNLEKMKKEVNDSRSAYYYPKLWKRFQDNDTTLLTEDYRYLYYGYSFQPDYNSLNMSPARDSIKQILNQQGDLTPADYERLEKFITEALKGDPFSPQYLNMLAGLYKNTGKDDLFERIKYKFSTIVDAILSTGDGRSTKTGWFVTNVEHEYDLIRILGFKFGGQQSLVDGPCDYMTLEENDYGLKGLYFNVSITMADLDKMLGQPGKRGKNSKK